MAAEPRFLDPGDGRRLAYHHTPGHSPGVLFCGGFRSDMTGIKARTLEAHCRDAGRAYTRFDYTGHGASSGRFEDGTIGAWKDDTLEQTLVHTRLGKPSQCSLAGDRPVLAVCPPGRNGRAGEGQAR